MPESSVLSLPLLPLARVSSLPLEAPSLGFTVLTLQYSFFPFKAVHKPGVLDTDKSSIEGCHEDANHVPLCVRRIAGCEAMLG